MPPNFCFFIRCNFFHVALTEFFRNVRIDIGGYLNATVTKLLLHEF